MLDERRVRPTVLLDYIENLPPTSALWRTLEPDVAWTPDLMLLAALVDEIRVLRWEFERVNFKGRTERPEPIPRPGVSGHGETDRKVIGAGDGFETIAEFEAWYASVRAPAPA